MGSEMVDRRTWRAKNENLEIVGHEGSGVFTVNGSRGYDYRVNVRNQRCTCPDWRKERPVGGCKHLRKVRFAIDDGTVSEPVSEDDSAREERPDVDDPARAEAASRDDLTHESSMSPSHEDRSLVNRDARTPSAPSGTADSGTHRTIPDPEPAPSDAAARIDAAASTDDNSGQDDERASTDDAGGLLERAVAFISDSLDALDKNLWTHCPLCKQDTIRSEGIRGDRFTCPDCDATFERKPHDKKLFKLVDGDSEYHGETRHVTTWQEMADD